MFKIWVNCTVRPEKIGFRFFKLFLYACSEYLRDISAVGFPAFRFAKISHFRNFFRDHFASFSHFVRSQKMRKCLLNFAKFRFNLFREKKRKFAKTSAKFREKNEICEKKRMQKFLKKERKFRKKREIMQKKKTEFLKQMQNLLK